MRRGVAVLLQAPGEQSMIYGAAMSGELVTFSPVAAHLDEGYAQPPLPEDEDARCQTLSMLVLSQDDDPVLASLCKLLCSLLKVPAAAVSIVEREWQYLKSTGDTQPRLVTPRSMSFCAYTFLPKLPSVLVVEDTLKDERFQNHPLVVAAPMPIRFYAGAPLIASNGHRLGAMCMVDSKPRKLTVEDYRVLNSCAEMVVRRLESEFFSLLQTVATDKLLRSLDTFAAPIMLCDMGARGWPILHANAGWVQRLGMSKGQDVRQFTLWDLFEATAESQDVVLAGFQEPIIEQRPFSVELQLRSGFNRDPMRLVFKPATQGSLDPYTPYIDVPADAPHHAKPGEDLPYYFVRLDEARGALNGKEQAAPRDGAAPTGEAHTAMQTPPSASTAPAASADAGTCSGGAAKAVEAAEQAAGPKGHAQQGSEHREEARADEGKARVGCFGRGRDKAANGKAESSCVVC